MHWTTPLKSQQIDFINRLDRDPATLLHCPIPGRHSEVVKIAGSQLKKIRAFCRQSLVESELPSSLPSMPVRQMLLEQLPLELAIEAISTVLTNRVTKIHPEERQATNRSLNLSVKNISGEPQAIFGIQVKVTQGMSQAAQWSIAREEIHQNIVVICLLFPNPLEEEQTEYAPILAGFLPTNLIQCSLPFVDLKLSDLLYIGGLTSYLDSLKLESRDSQWLRPLISGSSYVYPLAIGGDGQTVVGSSYDGTIKIWHLSDRQLLLDCLGGHIWSSYPITGSRVGQAFPDNRSDQNMDEDQKGLGTLIRSLPGHSSGVSALAISPNGKILASGGYDGIISIWNLENGERLRQFPGHSSTVKPMIVSPDGNLLATGSTDKHLKLWHLQSLELVRSFPLSDPPISIAISPDGQTIVSGSTEGLLQIWQIATGETKYQLTGHAGLVRSLAISDDGQTLASSSTEKTIKLWNLETGELLNTLTGHTDPMMAFTVKPDGKTLELSLCHRPVGGGNQSM